MIFGKLLGGLFGLAWFGWLGAAIGVYVGHLFDRGLAQNIAGLGPGNQAEIQQAFFRMTFVMMGRLAKVDGRVSEDEIKWAEFVMGRMNLAPEMRRQAIGLFNEGKDSGFDLDAELEAFRRLAGRHANLVQMFLEIQIQAGYADGQLSQNELSLLQQVCRKLGISGLRFEMIHGRIKAERAFAEDQYRQQGSARTHYSEADKLKEAYNVLGVQREAGDAEVKKAYRRLMSQHHPDKLVAKGLPEEMMKIAKEKTQEIQAAYELIKKSRG